MTQTFCVILVGKNKLELERSNSEDKHEKITRPETTIAPETLWLEDVCFLLGKPIFRDYVSFMEGTFIPITCALQSMFIILQVFHTSMPQK